MDLLCKVDSHMKNGNKSIIMIRYIVVSQGNPGSGKAVRKHKFIIIIRLH